MAQARDALGEDYKVLALIGDGALTGGLAYEGLSNAGQCGRQLLVILNDNGMSIAQNVGAVAQHLARQRLKPQYLSFKQGYRRVMGSFWLGRKVYRATHSVKKALKQSLLPCSMFENMGFTYLGPVDGHDLSHPHEDSPVRRRPEGAGSAPRQDSKGKGLSAGGAEPGRLSRGVSL